MGNSGSSNISGNQGNAPSRALNNAGNGDQQPNRGEFGNRTVEGSVSTGRFFIRILILAILVSREQQNRTIFNMNVETVPNVPSRTNAASVENEQSSAPLSASNNAGNGGQQSNRGVFGNRTSETNSRTNVFIDDNSFFRDIVARMNEFSGIAAGMHAAERNVESMDEAARRQHYADTGSSAAPVTASASETNTVSDENQSSDNSISNNVSGNQGDAPLPTSNNAGNESQQSNRGEFGNRTGEGGMFTRSFYESIFQIAREQMGSGYEGPATASVSVTTRAEAAPYSSYAGAASYSSNAEGFMPSLKRGFLPSAEDLAREERLNEKRRRAKAEYATVLESDDVMTFLDPSTRDLDKDTSNDDKEPEGGAAAC